MLDQPFFEDVEQPFFEKVFAGTSTSQGYCAELEEKILEAAKEANFVDAYLLDNLYDSIANDWELVMNAAGKFFDYVDVLSCDIYPATNFISINGLRDSAKGKEFEAWLNSTDNKYLKLDADEKTGIADSVQDEINELFLSTADQKIKEFFKEYKDKAGSEKTKIRLTDGSSSFFYEEDSKAYPEDIYHDGSNYISRATDCQGDRQTLYTTKNESCILYSSFHVWGKVDTYEKIGASEAIEWLFKNQYDEEQFPAFLKSTLVVQEVEL